MRPNAAARLAARTRKRYSIPGLLEVVSRRQKQAVAVATDAVALPLALWLALWLRQGQLNPNIASFWPAFVVAALICIPVFGRLGLYRQVVRYVGPDAFFTVVKGVTVTALVIAAVAYIVPLRGFPRSVPIIFWMLALAYVAGTRFAVRGIFTWMMHAGGLREPVLVWGAGSNGAELVRASRTQGELEVVAFIDDKPAVQGNYIDGVFVYPPEQLAQVLKKENVRQVLVTVSSVATSRRSRILRTLEPHAVHVRLIPDMTDLLSGRDSLLNAREVGIQDLLGRDAVEPLDHLMKASVVGQSVMVTGAGGSIGSELCRQIVTQSPRLLIMLDQSEYGLYETHKQVLELTRREELPVTIVTVLGSVTNRMLMERTLARHSVDTLYHAAAYKHVSLVERNAIQGIKNNTFGTLYAAEAAIATGVSNFILISTDKAVRTTSVMGASKRLAEMVLQALQETTNRTTFSMVRFGNVLGSSGSVVPLFLEQIRQGGPVTVTHAEVTRYFMTIPEAAQLVLQAASMARGGDVFLLDMGTPVKILDLAKRMIRLKGFRPKTLDAPDGDIAIEITGLKPGEKLYEELLMGEAAAGTDHRKIMRAEENFVSWAELRGALNTLEQACDTYDFEAIKAFIENLVEGADLSAELVDLTTTAEVVPFRPSER